MRHPDRTTKQPLRWLCRNPECSVDGQRFEFDGDRDRCPKCGREHYPYVQLLALIHYLQKDPAGPILSRGLRYRIACDPTRTQLATTTNNEAATGEPGAVTCPGCRQILRKAKGLVSASGQILGSDTAKPTQVLRT